MPEVRIAAETRTEFGKGGARRTRRAGNVPAVLYGHGSDPRHISVPTRAFESALRNEGANVLLELDLADGSELALPKSIQRDPVRGIIEHIDLILVRRGERIVVEIPVEVVGDVAAGGLLDQPLTTLTVSAEATKIPTGIEVSLENLAIGDSVHASQVSLPEGVELVGDPEQIVLQLLAAPTAEELEAEPGEGQAAEGEAGREGEGDGESDAESDAAAE